jgi:hypothetical protein
LVAGLQITHNTRENHMTHKLTTFFAAAAIFAGVTAATTVLAEETASPQPRSAEGSTSHGGTMSMMGQMRPDHMKQMTGMVEVCNRMMESVGNPPTRPDKQQAPHG